MATEKRAIGNDNLNFKISTVIVDIEGTTTSINFVKETLFPYVRENLKQYVEANWCEKDFQEDLTLLKEQATKDAEDKVEGVVAILDGDSDDVKLSVINNVLWQMDNDRKTKALKQLQGHIWKNGYKSGKLVGHIFEEVKECLEAWTEAGKKIYVYSSGSVEAQKLLFGSTEKGDLLSMFAGYFDTAVGAKTEAASYVKILEHLKESGHVSGPKDALFLTDVPNEAKAAAEAGLETVLVVREGNAPLTEDAKKTFPVINTFSDLILEGNNKRRKLSDEKLSDNNSSEGNKEEKMDVTPSDAVAGDDKSEEAVEVAKASQDDTKASTVSSSDEKADVDEKVVEKDSLVTDKPVVVKASEDVIGSDKTSDTTEKMEADEEVKGNEAEVKTAANNGTEVADETTEVKVNSVDDVSKSGKDEEISEKSCESKEGAVNNVAKSDVKEVEKPVDKDTDMKTEQSEQEKKTTSDEANGEASAKENTCAETVKEEKTEESKEEKMNRDVKVDEINVGKKEITKESVKKNGETNGKKIDETSSNEKDLPVQTDAKVSDDVGEEKKDERQVSETEPIVQTAESDAPVKEVKSNGSAEKEELIKTENGNKQEEKPTNGEKANETDSKISENCEPTEETDNNKTDTIKANGAHEKDVEKSEKVEEKENGVVADGEKVVKEKVVEKAIENNAESNGIENTV